jgi:ABC-type transport system involved in multi-copper enzyme maturation permease subunit
MADLIKLWAVFFLLICMAALAYGALFLLIGTLFPRRSMVFAVGYMILVEGIIAFVPAVINQFTMRHHLTALAIRWLDFRFASDDFADRILGFGEPTWQNMGILLLSPLVLLSVTIYLIVNREYITADEN